MTLDQLRFDNQGLIPAVVQGHQDGQVLMLGYMNRVSLEKTLATGLCWFFSRSRQRLWQKGEQSGHVLRVVSITVDCDADALLIRARPAGPACHTGQSSCFFNPLLEGEPPFSLEALYALLLGRKEHPEKGSYTSYLFGQGLDKILKKVGEESTEVILAAKGGHRGETIYEIADLCYHVLVLMAQMGIMPEDIARELAGRQVVDRKEKQRTSTVQG